MKNIYFILIILLLTSLACSLSGLGQKAEELPAPTETIETPLIVEEPKPTTEIVIPTVEPTILFSDDFSSTSSGWDRDEWDDGKTDYDNGKYLIQIKTDQYDVWANPYLYFEVDVIIDVDAERVEGPMMNDFGIICRYVDISNFYQLLIGNDGYIEILKLESGETTSLYYEFSPGVVDDTFNHLTASCIGNMLTLYVNGEKVASVTDNTFTEGDVGLIAGAFEEAGVKILFDNFVVAQP